MKIPSRFLLYIYIYRWGIIKRFSSVFIGNFGDSCVIDTDCSSVVANTMCSDLVCACKNGWNVVNNVCIQRKYVINNRLYPT